jgi:hypothetical protein
MLSKVTRAQTWEKVNPAGYDYFISASFINDKEGWICSRSEFGQTSNMI